VDPVRRADRIHCQQHEGNLMPDTSVEPVKVSIIYYSSTGTTYELARAVAEGAEKAGA